MFRKIVYCSPIEGVIHWQGKPLENVTLTRELQSGGFKNEEYSDKAVTNELGKFTFGVVEERRFLRPDLLSANPRVSQLIWLQHEGNRYAIWSYSKQNFDLGTESDEGIIRINCDLSTYEQYSHGRIVRCQHNGNQQ